MNSLILFSVRRLLMGAVRHWSRRSILAVAIAGGVISGCEKPAPIDYGGPLAEWPHWGNSAGGLRNSPLTQITPHNVKHLKVAWTYRTGELPPDDDKVTGWMFSVTPVVADGRLYLCTPRNKVVALDPETGRELWTHDPPQDFRQDLSYNPKLGDEQIFGVNCRGVTYYRDDRALTDAAATCAARILATTVDAKLIALDSATGERCRDFGNDGRVDLTASLGEVRSGEYNITSPPVVVAERIIVTGARIGGRDRVATPAGVIRAYDVHTGALEWVWNPLPPGVSDEDLAPPGETYARGTVNAWSVSSVDHERGLIFIPTGNPQPDYYSGDRNGLDYYGTSTVALDAATGRVVWHFQAVHRDIWDYDVPSQPVLFDFPTERGRIPAVAQATKSGHIFILHRETGEPLVPVEERPVPQLGGVPEETPAPTQPFPTNPAYNLHPGDLSEEEMWGFTPWDRAKCREKFRQHRYEGLYTPPSPEGSIFFPSILGITNWGGIAIDSTRDILIANTSRFATINSLVPQSEVEERKARGEFPLFPMEGSPYTYALDFLLSPFGAPCNSPPWGTLAAIDLKAGKQLWEIPLGTTRGLAPFPFWFNLGAPGRGGAIVTASGITFIAATPDSAFRAFDTTTGEKLWQDRLPAAGLTVPITYRVRAEGKQYVVIAAGGGGQFGVPRGDYLVAYALEE